MGDADNMRGANNRHRRLRRIALLAFVVLALIVATAPLTDASGARSSKHAARKVASHAHLVTVVARDFFFQMPTRIPSGLTEFVFVNHGAQGHMMQVFKLKGNATDATLLKALQAPRIQSLLAVATAAGGANSIEPGHHAHVFATLSPGRYDVVCFDAGPNGVPHFLRGMRKTFTVTASASASLDGDDRLSNGAPVSSGTITLRDFHISLPSTIHTRGAHTFRVVNAGPQSHEFDLLKLAPGKSFRDVLAALRANREPPATEVGGSAAIAPHTTAWVETDLAPGTYVALCNVPDLKTQMPHALMGMIVQFTVR